MSTMWGLGLEREPAGIGSVVFFGSVVLAIVRFGIVLVRRISSKDEQEKRVQHLMAEMGQRRKRVISVVPENRNYSGDRGERVPPSVSPALESLLVAQVDDLRELRAAGVERSAPGR